MKKKRTVALALGLAIALTCAWFILPYSQDSAGGSTVVLVDRSEQLRQLLDRRQVTPEPGSGAPLYDTDDSFRRTQLPERVAAYFYSAIDRGRHVYDPLMSSRLRPNWRSKRHMQDFPGKTWIARTNSLGLRNDEEPAVPAPSLRILVTGDSHIEGVCSNRQNLCNQLALRLRAAGTEDAEVLNSAAGGYDIYNYVGVVEARASLKPDLYVVIVYGGNDFIATMYLQHYHQERGPPNRGPFDPKLAMQTDGVMTGVLPQELYQVIFFLNNPGDEEIVVQTATSACMEMKRLAEAAGARIMFVYLPPPFTGQPHLYAEERDRFADALELPPTAVEVSNRIADAWLADLRERELEVVDLRTAFAEVDDPLYWRSDHHINLAAHALIAEVLEPIVRALHGPGR